MTLSNRFPMRVAEASSSPYRLASKAVQSVVVASVVAAAAGASARFQLGLSGQFCYYYFEICSILLHLFNGLGLVIADLNYCQA